MNFVLDEDTKMMDFILGLSIGDYVLLVIFVLLIFSIFIYEDDDDDNKKVIDITHICIIALFVIGMAMYVFGVPFFF